MFIWEFVADSVFNQIIDWIHAQLVSVLSEFFGMITNMGVELFEFTWVQAIILFFTYLAWALFAVGLVLAVFETAIAYQNGQGNLQGTFLNILKGFLATSLISTVPIELFKFTISLQTSFSKALSILTNAESTIGEVAQVSLIKVGELEISAVFAILLLIAMGYSVVKVFFGNLKRGGILLTMIAVGSLYMLSVPRGYTDGFIGWCKQVTALCLTTFLQSIFLIAGLMVFRENLLLGIGLMLSANEIPRIADQFGLDTSCKLNLVNSAYVSSNIIHSIIS